MNDAAAEAAAGVRRIYKCFALQETALNIGKDHNLSDDE